VCSLFTNKVRALNNRFINKISIILKAFEAPLAVSLPLEACDRCAISRF
jgi:hypothetical protein